MSSIITYNNFITALQDIATLHKQLNYFGVGEDWEIAAETITYPCLWVNPIDALMRKGETGRYATFEITFNLKVFDLVYKGEENENEVHSDTLTILKDIVEMFDQHPYYTDSQFQVVEDLNFTPFTEKSDDEVSGWELEITFRTPNVTSFCGVPIDDIPNNAFPRPTSEVILTDLTTVSDVTGTSPIIVTTTSTPTSKVANVSLNDPLDYVASTGGSFTGQIDFLNDVNFTDNVSFLAVEGSAGTSANFDLSIGNIFIYEFPNATTVDYTNPQVGTYMFIFKEQTTSSAISFSANKWQKADAQTIALTATAGAKDVFTAVYDGSKMIIVQTENITNI